MSEYSRNGGGGQLETIKQSQTEMLELKITVTEIKISPNGFNSRYEGAEENIQQTWEDRSIESIPSEEQIEKKKDLRKRNA